MYKQEVFYKNHTKQKYLVTRVPYLTSVLLFFILITHIKMKRQ